jgi:hypothetical protein
LMFLFYLPANALTFRQTLFYNLTCKLNIRMKIPGETAFRQAAPKGNAKTLRQKNRSLTKLRKVYETPKKQFPIREESFRLTNGGTRQKFCRVPPCFLSSPMERRLYVNSWGHQNGNTEWSGVKLLHFSLNDGTYEECDCGSDENYDNRRHCV